MAAACALACGESRSRPVPPDVTLNFDTTQAITSPGIVAGVVDVAAPGGLDLLHLTLATADSLLVIDSLEGYAGEQAVVRPVTWYVPAGIPAQTTLRFRASARDFLGFETVGVVRLQTAP